MKTKTLRGLTIFSVAFLVISSVLLLLLGVTNPMLDDSFVLLFALGWCCAWVPLTFFSSVWLVFAWWNHLKTTYIWLSFQGLFLLALFGSQSSFPSILLVSATWLIVMIPLLGVVNFVYAYKHYFALIFMAISSVGYVWFIIIAWRIHGNLFDVWLSAMGENSITPLWLSGVMTLTGWLFIAGLISFFVETLQVLRREFVENFST